MSTNRFNLREIQPSDSPGLAKLITEFEDDLTTRFQVDPYEAIVHGTEFRTTGVVVESAGRAGFIGMGTVRFSTAQFNGESLPLAFLDGLKVQKESRGQGLGSQIASWRIQKARDEFGDRCVIVTGMLHTNQASHAVAAKWCRDFAESAIEVRFVPALERPPKSMPGVRAREIEPSEYEEFTRKQNQFFSQYNLYPTTDPEAIARVLGISVEGKRPYRYYAAVDDSGNLLAGAQTWARGLLKTDTVNHLPAGVSLMNRVLHVLPPDHVIRDVAVSGLWFEAGQERMAQHLWETIRWAVRDQGTTVTTGFDLRDPARAVVRLKPWHQPRPRITLAIHGPGPLDRERLLFAVGRV